MAFSVSYIYQIQDRYSKTLERINQKTKAFDSGVAKVQNRVGRLNKSMSGLQNMSSGIAAAGLATAAFFPIKHAIEFESVMADVKKVMNDITPEQFEDLKEKVMAAGVEVGKMPTGIGRIVESGAKLGINYANMPKFISLVSRASVAFDMLEGTAGDSIAAISNRLKLSIDQTGDLMDAINHLADNTAAGGSKMIEIISRTSGTMSLLRMPANVIAGWAAFADQVEVTPELAASGINMMINRMKVMPGMAEKMVKDPAKTIRDFLGRFETMEPAKRMVALTKVFGSEAGRFASKAVSNLDLLDKTMGLVGDSSKFAGSMSKELQNRLGTTENKLERMKAQLVNIAITFGDAFLPILSDITEAAAPVLKFIRNFTKQSPELSRFAIAFMLIAAAIVPLVAIGGIFITVFGAVSGTVAVVVGVIIALVSAVIALWDKIKAFFKFLLNIAKSTVAAIKGLFGSLGDVVSGMMGAVGPIIEGLSGLFGGGADVSVTADKAKAMQGSINGNILVSAEGGAKVKRAEMNTDIPGNLGLNMAGAM